MNTVTTEYQDNVPPHDHTCQFIDIINQVSSDTKKMIKGLYGPLDDPEKGFVHEIRADVKQIKSDYRKVLWMFILTVLSIALKIITEIKF